MKTVLTILIIALIVACIVAFFLYRQAQKFQVQQAESQRLIDMNTMVVSMLIIDKKKMRLKDAPFPAESFAGAPFYTKMMKVGVVKAKIGPRIVNMMCEPKVFEEIPLRAEIKAKISGAYISEVLKGAVLSEKEIAKRKKEREKAAKKAAKK